MKKRLSIVWWLFLILFLPSGAFAWGSATHAYFAKELGQGMLNSQEIYGATVPDLFNLMRDLPDYDYVVDQTHHHFSQVETKARKMGLDTFAFGFVSHNERWGADYTAHKKGRTTREGYVVTKSKLLAQRLKPQLEEILDTAGVPLASLLAGQLSSELAHPLIETAIDLLIKRNEDPSIGLEIFHSAQDRPSSIPDLLVALYARNFARHMKVSEEEAGEMIREAEAEFQQMMILQGEILTQEESEAIQDLADQGAALVNTFLKSATGKDVDTPPEVLAEFINLAISEVEADYGQEVAATLSYLKNRRSLSSYLHRILRKN
jgi:hypothetical protein